MDTDEENVVFETVINLEMEIDGASKYLDIVVLNTQYKF